MDRKREGPPERPEKRKPAAEQGKKPVKEIPAKKDLETGQKEYPAKQGYHGTDEEKNLNPEE